LVSHIFYIFSCFFCFGSSLFLCASGSFCFFKHFFAILPCFFLFDTSINIVKPLLDQRFVLRIHNCVCFGNRVGALFFKKLYDSFDSFRRFARCDQIQLSDSFFVLTNYIFPMSNFCVVLLFAFFDFMSQNLASVPFFFFVVCRFCAFKLFSILFMYTITLAIIRSV